MERSKISIIVPVYNAEKTLKQCVNSILSQTYKNIEVILVNDGSTDDSLKVCNKFSDEDKRVLVLSQKNMGVSASRNKGLKFAKGEFIQFIDSDDYIDKFMCEKLVKNIKQYKADVVVCGYNKISFNGIESKQGPRAVVEGIANLEQVFATAFEGALFNAPWNKIYKRSKIKETFLEGLCLGEDLKFNLSYFSNCDKFVFTNDCLYNYTDYSNSSLSERYDDDLLNLQLNLYKSSQDFCVKNFNGSIGIDSTKKVFEKEIYYYIKKLILKSNYKRRDKLEKIKECLYITEIKERMNDVRTKDKQIRLLFILLRHNLISLVYLFFYLKTILKGDELY